VPVGERIGAAMRCIVLITVFLMTEWANPTARFSQLDWVVVVGSAYVLVTTFVRPAREAWRQRTIALTALDVLLITWLLMLTDGLTSELYVLYYLPVLHAGLRLDLRDAVAASVLAAVCYLFVGVISQTLEAPIESSGILRMVTFSISAVVIAVLLGVLARQTRLERGERERAQELLKRSSAIYEIARAINANLDLEQLVAQVAEIVVRECPAADAARVALVSDEGEPQVRTVAGRAKVFGEGEGDLDACNWILSNEDGLAIRAGRASPKSAQGVALPGCARHYLGAPMIGKGQVVGCIELAARGGDGFRDTDEELLAVIAAQAAVAIENARQYGRAQLLAITDRLTGLWNHAELHQRLREEIARSQRHGRPLTLLFADLDNFKRFNDSHGHRMGDELLRQVAARIRSAVRSTDFAARYGGDEFAIILPETPIHGASVASDELRRAIAAEPFRLGSERVHITISGGVAAYPEDASSAEELIDACDAALNEAKRSGGDYIRLHSHQG